MLCELGQEEPPATFSRRREWNRVTQSGPDVLAGAQGDDPARLRAALARLEIDSPTGEVVRTRSHCTVGTEVG
jgi:hypothetical protein